MVMIQVSEVKIIWPIEAACYTAVYITQSCYSLHYCSQMVTAQQFQPYIHILSVTSAFLAFITKQASNSPALKVITPCLANPVSSSREDVTPCKELPLRRPHCKQFTIQRRRKAYLVWTSCLLKDTWLFMRNNTSCCVLPPFLCQWHRRQEQWSAV